MFRGKGGNIFPEGRAALLRSSFGARQRNRVAPRGGGVVVEASVKARAVNQPARRSGGAKPGRIRRRVTVRGKETAVETDLLFSLAEPSSEGRTASDIEMRVAVNRAVVDVPP